MIKIKSAKLISDRAGVPKFPIARNIFNLVNKTPVSSILHWDASLGWQDQTGNQSVQLIGSAYPTVTSSGAVNEAGREWGFDISTGAVRDAFLSGDVTLVFQATLPLMSTLTDSTDYSLFGDLLFVRRDGASGSFKASDGTNSATVAYDWDDGEVVAVVVQADGDVMRVGVV